jgi:hypothetical protein
LVLEAKRGVDLMSRLPGLYVFGPEGEFVSRLHRFDPRLADPAFARAEEVGFWSELVDSHLYHVPWLDPCSIDAMVDMPLGFLAPEDGLLFVQLVGDGCRACRSIDTAIEALIAAHPELPVRWVKIHVSARFARID